MIQSGLTTKISLLIINKRKIRPLMKVVKVD